MTPSERHVEAALRAAVPSLRRLLGGDRDAVEDVLQETRLRAWRTAPPELDGPRLRAWATRVARNLALDEVRRRTRRGALPLVDAAAVAAPDGYPERRRAVAQALAALTPHERLLLLLRHEAGLAHAEIAALVAVTPEAARKRVARARASFRAALRDAERADDRPTVALLLGDDDGAAYVRWLEGAGARVRALPLSDPGLDLAGADALVLSGSNTDLHPRTYGAPADPRCVRPDLRRDLRDLAALRHALREDVPVLGVCRGAQLLNVLFGGDLHVHVDAHGGDRPHAVHAARDTTLRRVAGPAPTVVRDHHQAVRRLGRGLRVAGRAPDGLVEALEVPGRRFALGLQWHPERGGGERLADALVETAAA